MNPHLCRVLAFPGSVRRIVVVGLLFSLCGGIAADAAVVRFDFKGTVISSRSDSDPNSNRVLGVDVVEGQSAVGSFACQFAG